MDLLEVSDFLEERGLHEASFELIQECMKDPEYRSVLKRDFVKRLEDP